MEHIETLARWALPRLAIGHIPEKLVGIGVIERIEDVVEPLPQLVLAVPAFVDAFSYDEVSNLLINLGIRGVRESVPVEAKPVLLKQRTLVGAESGIERMHVIFPHMRHFTSKQPHPYRKRSPVQSSRQVSRMRSILAAMHTARGTVGPATGCGNCRNDIWTRKFNRSQWFLTVVRHS